MKTLLIYFACITCISCTSPGYRGAITANFAGQEDDAGLSRTTEMLDEDIYWNIIDNSFTPAVSEGLHQEQLINEIGKLSPKEIIGFRLRTDKLLCDTYTDSMWYAAVLMNGGCSEDAFEYFRNWLISRGRETYYKAKENPDNLVAELAEEQKLYEFEGLWFATNEAFNRKTGTYLTDYLDYDSLKLSDTNYPSLQFSQVEHDSATMQRICPTLFEKVTEKE